MAQAMRCWEVAVPSPSSGDAAGRGRSEPTPPAALSLSPSFPQLLSPFLPFFPFPFLSSSPVAMGTVTSRGGRSCRAVRREPVSARGTPTRVGVPGWEVPGRGVLGWGLPLPGTGRAARQSLPAWASFGSRQAVEEQARGWGTGRGFGSRQGVGSRQGIGEQAEGWGTGRAPCKSWPGWNAPEMGQAEGFQGHLKKQ